MPTPRPAPPPRLFGARISGRDQAGLVGELLAPVPAGAGARALVTMNLDHVVRLQRNADFRAAYDRAWTVTIDGAPVWLFSRLKGLSAPRCTGADLIAGLVPALRPERHRPFFVVSTEETGRRLEALLRRQGFAAGAVAWTSPLLGFDVDPDASQRLCAHIRAHRATHLVFGLGAPKSEIWIDRHRHALGDLHALAVGSGPDFLVGTARRAPKAMQAAGLEWAWRVAHDWRRLCRRYLVDSWAFIPAALADLARRDTSEPQWDNR